MAPLVRFNEEEATATFNGVLRHSEKCITIISRPLPFVKRERHIMAKPTLKRRADGRYVKTVVDKRTGKRKSFYGATEREVYRKIFEYEQKQEDGRTFAEVADQWWGEAWERISPTSVRGYRVAYESAVEYFDKTPIAEINAGDVMAYLRLLAAKKYAKKTVKNYKIVLNRIFSVALRERDVNINPTQGVEIPRGLTEMKRMSAAPSDEKSILTTSDVWIMPKMALYTGLRKGELLALQWKDIDFEGNTIAVNKSLYYEGGAHLKSTKTEAGDRIVPLLAPLKEILLPLKKSPEDFVLGEAKGKPLSQKRFRTLAKHYEQQTGVKVELHRLRHSYATIAVKSNVPPKILQTVLGHKNISTTMDIYTDVRKESIDKMGEILNDFYSK